MAGIILGVGALLTDGIKEIRKNHKAKHADYDFDKMKEENAKLYARITPPSSPNHEHTHSQSTPQGFFDTNAPSSTHQSYEKPPNYEKLNEIRSGDVHPAMRGHQLSPSDRVATRDMALGR